MEDFIVKCISLLNNYSDEFSEISKCICERQDEILFVLEKYLRQGVIDKVVVKEETDKDVVKEEKYKDVVKEKIENNNAVDEKPKRSASEEGNVQYVGDFFPIQWPAVRNESRHQSLLAIYIENQYVLNQTYANIVSLMDHSTKKFLLKLTRYQKAIKCYVSRFSPRVLDTSTIEDVLLTIANAFSHLYYIEFITETNYPQHALDRDGYEIEDNRFREAFGNQMYALRSYMTYVELSIDEFLKDDHAFMDQAFKLHLNMCEGGKGGYSEELKESFRFLKIDQEALHFRMLSDYPICPDFGSVELDKGLEREEMEELNKNLSKNLTTQETDQIIEE